jgi:hypothetical protein
MPPCYNGLVVLNLNHTRFGYAYGDIPELVRKGDFMTLVSVGGKSAIASMGVWGGLAMLVPVIDKVLDQTGIIPGGILGDTVDASTVFLGALMAIWGRIRAAKKITSLF